MVKKIVEEPGQGVRFGFYLKPAFHARWTQAMETIDAARAARGVDRKVSQSEFLAIVASTLSKEELENLDKRYLALVELEEALLQRASRDMLDMVAGKPASTILKMRDAVVSSKAPA